MTRADKGLLSFEGANTRITLNRHRTWRKNFSPCLPKQNSLSPGGQNPRQTVSPLCGGFCEQSPVY